MLLQRWKREWLSFTANPGLSSSHICPEEKSLTRTRLVGSLRSLSAAGAGLYAPCQPEANSKSRSGMVWQSVFHTLYYSGFFIKPFFLLGEVLDEMDRAYQKASLSLLSSGKVEDKVTGEQHTAKQSRLILALSTSSEVGRTDPPASQDDPEIHCAQQLLPFHQSNISAKSTMEQSATLYTNCKFEHDFKTMFNENSIDTNLTVNIL